MPVMRFGFSQMIGSHFSWRFCIKYVGMVKQKQHVDTHRDVEIECATQKNHFQTCC